MPKRSRGEAGLADDRYDTEAVKKMADICQKSIDRNRFTSWTDFARTKSNLYGSKDFGVGSEPACKCYGCHRLLPLAHMTGDHIIPKSKKDLMRTEFAFLWDRLEPILYGSIIRESVNQFRSDPEMLKYVQIIRKYDNELLLDLRNIQPMCAYCNSKKGNKLSTETNLTPLGIANLIWEAITV